MSRVETKQMKAELKTLNKMEFNKGFSFGVMLTGIIVISMGFIMM